MKVLVILASYNGEKYIKEQVDSILAQEGVCIQINVYDDCSNDNTISILESYNNPKIKIQRNAVPSGSAAINFCNAIANLNHTELNEYSYFAFSDQDDIWMPNKIATSIEKMSNTYSHLYASNLIMFAGESTEMHFLGIIKKDFKQKKYDFLFEGASAGCTYVLDKSLFIKLQQLLRSINYSKWKYFSHDWFIYFIARINKFKVIIDSNSFIYYRIHDTNAHGHLNILSMNSILNRIKLFNNGWFLNQINGFEKMLCKSSTEYNIYYLFKKNRLNRLHVILKYNFSLFRNPVKFLQFFLLNLFH